MTQEETETTRKGEIYNSKTLRSSSRESKRYCIPKASTDTVGKKPPENRKKFSSSQRPGDVLNSSLISFFFKDFNLISYI